MTERSLPWAGTVTGDCGPYTDADWGIVDKILAACGKFEGVAQGFLNSLECTDGGDNVLSVNTGGALVDGKIYQNDAQVDASIPSAVGGGNTRIDRIVLRANWAAQTVRIFRIAGIDAGSPTPPAIVQTSGTTYDLKLCQVLVNTAGALTVTDERVSSSLLVARQGDVGAWGDNYGTTNFNLAGANAVMQIGCIGTVNGLVTVTFPQQFAVKPAIFFGMSNVTPAPISPCAVGVETDHMHVCAMSFSAGAPIYIANTYLTWMAIGPLA